MKNYNKILEAVNKGIKFALDDFEDNEDIQGQDNSKVKYQGGINEYIDLMDETVDLGLPSGTIWSKYNLGVNSTQLSKPEDWYGNYYAWGELEGNKPKYNWSNYKFGESNDKLTKYCNNPKYSLNGAFFDNLTELLPEDDVAYQFKKCHNYKFHIPTKEQCEELINYTNNYWINNYNPNKTFHNLEDDDGGIKGLNGIIFEGKNENILFIPAAGFCNGSNIEGGSSNFYLWSSNLHLDIPYSAYSMGYNGNINIYVKYRYKGFAVRPVINL